MELDNTLLAFNSSNWNVSQQVKMRALEDDTMDCEGHYGATVLALFTSDDPNYDMDGISETVFNGYALYGVVTDLITWVYTAENQTSLAVSDNDVAELLPECVLFAFQMMSL